MLEMVTHIRHFVAVTTRHRLQLAGTRSVLPTNMKVMERYSLQLCALRRDQHSGYSVLSSNISCGYSPDLL